VLVGLLCLLHYCSFLRCFDTVSWDHTSLFESALRQSSPCQINVKFAILVGFGLNLSVVYIL